MARQAHRLLLTAAVSLTLGVYAPKVAACLALASAATWGALLCAPHVWDEYQDQQQHARRIARARKD